MLPANGADNTSRLGIDLSFTNALQTSVQAVDRLASGSISNRSALSAGPRPSVYGSEVLSAGRSVARTVVTLRSVSSFVMNFGHTDRPDTRFAWAPSW